MPGRLQMLGLALILGAFSAGMAHADVERGESLHDVSLAILEIYNAGDGIGLYERLSDPMAVRLSTEALAERLSECHQRFGSLQRVSLPVASTKTSALFAAYFETGARDMYLELDLNGDIRLLTFAGLGESCALIGPETLPE
jgi:hypothetical protein